MLKEFKEFAMKGNLVDIAVGFVMGAAFNKVVASFTGGIVSPLIGLLFDSNFNDLKYIIKEGAMNDAGEKVGEVALLYGEFLINELKTNAFIENDFIWVSILQYSIFIIMLYVAISTLYHFGVKEGRQTRFFSIGALVTTLLFLLTTYFFGLYINNFSQYNELYGSIGALLIMMFYIWINSNLLLLGFELNISLQRLKEKCIV